MTKIAVLMSGGVDSSVACYILKEKGYNIVGLTGVFYEFEKKNPYNDNIFFSQKIAKDLGFKHYVYDLKDLFNEKVIKYFYDSYLSGKTPNPCVRCNELVKIKALYLKAIELGCTHFATGHYSQILNCPNTGRYFLRAKLDEPKDQSYFLFALKQDILSKMNLPLQGLNKSRVRQLALKHNLISKNRPDSQEICFIENNRYKDYILKKLEVKAAHGQIVDKKGNILATHNGIWNFTIGQRKGLGISSQKPLYVIKIDSEKNSILVGDSEDLYQKRFEVENINLMKSAEINTDENYLVKIRSTAQPALCKISKKNNNALEVFLDKKERAVTPGQAAVFYDFTGDIVFGGWIK